jgi:hypothetical protein
MLDATDVGWVVYRMPVKGNAAGAPAVCEQAEWEAMDRARPGHFTLVRAGIASEGEAERLARGTSGEAGPRNSRLGLAAWPAEAAAARAASDDPPAGERGTR